MFYLSLICFIRYATEAKSLNNAFLVFGKKTSFSFVLSEDKHQTNSGLQLLIRSLVSDPTLAALGKNSQAKILIVAFIE